MIGIYGFIAYLVGQGSREVGIRLALGATQQGILGLILRGGMMLTLYGVAVGVATAFLVSRLMRTLVFGIAVTDGATFLAVPLLLGFIALIASFIPAVRAARIDPAVSLRYE